jgi:hypothetical protein
MTAVTQRLLAMGAPFAFTTWRLIPRTHRLPPSRDMPTPLRASNSTPPVNTLFPRVRIGTVRIISADGAKQYQSSGPTRGNRDLARRFSPTAPFVVSSCDDAVVRLHLLSPYDKRGTVNRLGPTLAGPVRRAHFQRKWRVVAASGGKFSLCPERPLGREWTTEKPFNVETHSHEHPRL